MQKLIKSLLDKRGLLSTVSISVTLILLLMPTSGSSGVMLFPHFDKIAHVAVFGACAFFLYLDLRLGQKSRKRALTTQIKIVTIGLIIGYIVEIIQDTCLGREYSLQDVLADAVGLIIGLVIAKFLYPSITRYFNVQ